MTDHAKRLAEVEAVATIAATSPWTAWRLVRDHMWWLLAEHRAASDALTAAGIPDDGRSLAERFTGALEAVHAALDPVVARRDAHDAPLLSVVTRAATATRIALDLADERDRFRAVEAERDRFMAALVAANNVLAEVCHGDHEHQIECHADTLPAEHRRVAVAAEQASGILAEVVLDIVEQGSRAGADDATEAAEALARCARGEHRKAGETMPGSCADCGVDWGDLDTEDGPATGLDVALVGDAEGMAALVGLDASRPVEQTAGAAARCLHESAAYGPNMPLRHGSARTKVCTGCGAYKLVTWHDKDYSGWRSTDVHADVALAEAESEDL